MSSDGLGLTIERYHRAVAALITGDPEPYKELFSHHQDVTLGYPFGPVACGWEEVSSLLDMASGVYREGEIVGFENLARCVAPTRRRR